MYGSVGRDMRHDDALRLPGQLSPLPAVIKIRVNFALITRQNELTNGVRMQRLRQFLNAGS